jgi:hypothetical protein
MAKPCWLIGSSSDGQICGATDTRSSRRWIMAPTLAPKSRTMKPLSP